MVQTLQQHPVGHPALKDLYSNLRGRRQLTGIHAEFATPTRKGNKAQGIQNHPLRKEAIPNANAYRIAPNAPLGHSQRIVQRANLTNHAERIGITKGNKRIKASRVVVVLRAEGHLQLPNLLQALYAGRIASILIPLKTYGRHDALHEQVRQNGRQHGQYQNYYTPHIHAYIIFAPEGGEHPQTAVGKIATPSTMTFREVLYQSILTNFRHRPTGDQTHALAKIANFLADEQDNACFILNGYAGTGKTSLLGALVNTLQEQDLPFLLCAPTGRAAKVLSRAAGHFASTIHRTIYQVEESQSGTPHFTQKSNNHPGAIIIVDEASMVGDGNLGSGFASTQNLLADLVSFVLQADAGRLILVGDDAQLPPVGQSQSPALAPQVMRRWFSKVETASLRAVVRQQEESGILRYATDIREIMRTTPIRLPRFDMHRYPDFQTLPQEDALDILTSRYLGELAEETMILTRSNRQANQYNAFIRQQILDREEDLTPGDRLMVCRNSYFWTKGMKRIPFLANGDIIRLERVYDRSHLYDHDFASLEFTLEEQPTDTINAMAMTAVLHANTPNLPREEASKLYQAVRQQLLEEHEGKVDKKLLQKDPHLNALQLKYAYAVTCHKAQGGQWDTVLIDPEIYPGLPVDLDLIRWLYTAITRATRRVYLINPPAQMLIDEA